VEEVTSKFALVIANTEYQDTSFAKLIAPGKDAEEFAQVLRDAELAAFDDVQVLTNEGEGKTRRSIARFFAERKTADLLLLYFSGHGVRNDQGQLFLAANDTEIKILEATGIPAEFITRAMNYSRSQRQVLILDCCNSGAFVHGSKSAPGVGYSMGITTAFEGNGYGRVGLTATDATQFAWEGDKAIGNTQKSVFTHFLIEGLKGKADRDSDGRISVDELYDCAYEQVVRRTPKQTPGKWSYRQQGDLILRDNLKIHDVKTAPLPSDLLDPLAHPKSEIRKAGGMSFAWKSDLRVRVVLFAIAVILSIWGGSVLLKSLAGFTPPLTETSIPQTLTPTTGVVSTMIGKDGMTLVYVPAGEFSMGSNGPRLDETPLHSVYLDAFWIDQTEVTNAMYAQCVQDRQCNPSGRMFSSTRESYYGNAEFDNYPVIHVSWEAAQK
jgi:hypothetical protein